MLCRSNVAHMMVPSYIVNLETDNRDVSREWAGKHIDQLLFMLETLPVIEILFFFFCIRRGFRR